MRTLLLFLLITGISFKAQSQLTGSIDTIEMSNLNSPAYPGFSILDLEPTSVSRPKSPQKIGAALLSGISENGTPNFAIETAPYWWESNPELKLEEYLDPTNIAQNIKQTFSVSGAYKKIEDQNIANPGTQLGAGIRFQPFPGKISENAKDTLDLVKTNTQLKQIVFLIQNEYSFSSEQAILDTINKEIKASEKIKRKKIARHQIKKLTDSIPFDSDNTNAYFNKLKDALEAAGSDEIIAFQALDAKRVGWILELAGASSIRVPGNAIDKSSTDRVSGWLNLSYKPDKTKLEFSLLGRYFTNFADTTTTSIESGLGIGYSSDNFSMLLEGLVRQFDYEVTNMNNEGEQIIKDKDQFSYRLALNFNYQVTKNIYLSGTVGKAHDKPWQITESSQLLTMFGLNFIAPTKATFK